MSAATANYWDIRPRSIVQPFSQPSAESVPIRVLGDPGGDVILRTTDPVIATVDSGVLSYGSVPGAAVIVAEAVVDGTVVSRRYLQVDLYREGPPNSPVRQIDLSGYVENFETGVWHFKYFTDWFDQWGCNIRVQGELAITLDCDRHYWMYYDVWGEIESMGAYNHDTLDLYLNNRRIRNFNPSPVIYPAWNQPCAIPRRTEMLDLWEYIGHSVTVRFKWDTKDGLYQMFDGWYVGNIRLVPKWWY